MPAPNSRTINLEWIHQDRNASLGISANSVGEDGSVSILRVDLAAPRDYFVDSVAVPDGEPSSGAPATPVSARALAFQSSAITRAFCRSDGRSLYATTNGELIFLWIDSQSNLQSLALPIRHGDRFLGLHTGGDADVNRTAAILTQDVSGHNTLTLVESPDPSAAGGAMRVEWSRTWPDMIAAFALSHDGLFLAVVTLAGVVTLLDRRRNPVWTSTVSANSTVVAVAVSAGGDVALIDQSGSICRLGASTGTVQWELEIPVGESVLPASMAAGLICCDGTLDTALCALNRVDAFGELEAVYLLLDGANGDILWEAATNSPINGVALTPNGGYGAISCQDGSITLLSFEDRVNASAPLDRALQERVQQLLSEAKQAYKSEAYESSVELLHQALDLNPGLCVGLSYYDDAVWSVRQRALAETKTVSAQALARVDAALKLLPNDERLIVRRNALSRLLAESVAREASVYLAESRVEEAISKYVEALTIDRTVPDIRASLLIATDQLTLSLLKRADVAFYEERFAEAIKLIERIAVLRPGEESIQRRLQLSRGLQAYATAMQLYVGKQYQEAVFWFRKALGLLPDHVEAAKYLEFAESFLREGDAPQPAPMPAAQSAPTPSPASPETPPTRPAQTGFHPRGRSDKSTSLPR